MKKIAHIMILTLVLAGAAFAQVGFPADPNFDLLGSQTIPGESIGQEFTGNTFIVTGSGGNYSFAHLTISFDYEGDPAEVDTSTITGGTWTLALYQDNVYVGTVFGDIRSGEIVWTKDDLGQVIQRNTEAELRPTGGTDAFAGGNYPAEPEQFGFYNSKTRFTSKCSDTKAAMGNLVF